ncbi:MAG TPA: helix-turn-helix transcriptional regulator [Mobilitalea sp.]|nr:helix-turn-helix transcriptional regulator [Mobilitalea sp.]
MSIGSKIKELREKKGISQKELGEAIDVSDVMVSMYEQDKKKPSIPTVERLATFFNTTTDEILGRENPKMSSIYLSLAKEAEENGIDPSDIKLAIDTIKRLRGGN